METKQKLIDSFNKNSAELVKVHLQEWKGKPYVDIRSWLLDRPGENGAEQPTHKGLTLSAELLPRLIQALQRTQEALEKPSPKATGEAIESEGRSEAGEESR
jgi:hypothetical protein